jgi:protein-S-isoprenylcysteine O-methyltransferase Ste14
MQMRPLFVHDPVVVPLVMGSLVLWLAIQAAVKRRQGSGGRGAHDWTLPMILVLLAVSYTGSFVAAKGHVATIGGDPWWPVIAGLVVIFLGSGFRAWAIGTLGDFFKFTVVVQDEHHVVERGPYGRLRHPAYLGGIVTMTGLGLTEGDWASVAIMSLGTLVAIAIRIQVEEHTLLEELGEPYAAYTRRTARLIPWLY